MANLKPWHKVVEPREDLREGRPLDASEFAVHLDRVREGSAPVDYQDPERFFQATGEATVPEIRLAVAEPGLDIGNVETAVEELSEACYYLQIERNRYRFGLAPNLNKLLADRRASIDNRAGHTSRVTQQRPAHVRRGSV